MNGCKSDYARLCGRLLLLGMVLCLLLGNLVFANPPESKDDQSGLSGELRAKGAAKLRKQIDQPNPKDFARTRNMRKKIEKIDNLKKNKIEIPKYLEEEINKGRFDQTDRVLVILVEFATTDTVTFDPETSTWDPIGKCDTSEFNGEIGTVKATEIIRANYGINAPTEFKYYGPLHNDIPRPLSAADRSGDMIWTPDFSPQFYYDLIFGDGIKFQYSRVDGSEVDLDFTGLSVRNYFHDLSSNRYDITGEVVGWLQVPHSMYWYGADQAPGARSGASGAANSGAIPGAGNSKSLVRDAVDALNKAYPNFDWAKYDIDGDGIIDRLWIIHAGLGEEDSPTILNRTSYGEGAMWSHSSAVALYPVDDDNGTSISISAYIMMPENCGIGVLAHEYCHNLGADDLYAYGEGETSAGFWTIMCDDWTGYPIGFEPPSSDPWHLDNWGWLEPFVITDISKEYTVKLGQASNFPGGDGVYRGVRISLPEGKLPLPVAPIGTYYWWGGKEDLTNGMMTLKEPLAIPSTGTINLSFQIAYDIEEAWDFLWVLATDDNGATWKYLTNDHSKYDHDPGWIGSNNGLPDDLKAAGIGGFSGYNDNFPTMETETFDISSMTGKNITIMFWYMTDWGTVYAGPFIDDIKITCQDGASTPTVIFADDAESDSGLWVYADPWQRNDGNEKFSHNYYLQWRNVSETGGYDRALADSRWRFGPANTGLLVWYNNNYYRDNEVFDYVNDYPGFGPKGRMLVVDAHPEPYRDPGKVALGFPNEGANLSHRSLMRDAPFSLLDSVDFTMSADYSTTTAAYKGYPAVRIFDDYFGYYPGAEFVARGPAYSESAKYRWVTKQWDASAVIPSTEFYGIKAPGYKANEQFRYHVTARSDGFLNAYLFPTGLGYDGGTGDPGDLIGNYGWKVEIIEQTDSQATVKIWNTRYIPTPTPTPTPTPVPDADFEATQTLSFANRNIQFIDKSTGNPEKWDWDFGDSNSSSLQNPVHAYDTPGTYSVSLTIFGYFGEDTETKQDYIVIKPIPSRQEILDYLLGKIQTLYGDLNGDGKVDVADLVWLILEENAGSGK